MKLFVGLGNPGSEYAGNRHNVGFMAADAIAEAHGFGPWRRRFRGLAAEGTIAGERVLLLKPQTYMNESGRSVGEAAHFLKIPESDIVVLYDEIDLAPGRVKVKTGGGNAGHNGLRSLSAQVGNAYVRVRIGVGHPGSKEAVVPYVLHDFAKADRRWLEPLLEAIAKSAGRLAVGDYARFIADLARHLDAEGAGPEPKRPAPRDAKPARPAHPAGEAVTKRTSVLAENLAKWLKRRNQA